MEHRPGHDQSCEEQGAGAGEDDQTHRGEESPGQTQRGFGGPVSQGPHPVADTADGPNVALGGRVVSELGPDVGDVDVDQVLFSDPVRPPDPLDELAAGESELGSLGQCLEQVELGTGQLHQGLPHLDLSGLRVQAQVAYGAHLRVSSGVPGHPRSSKKAADTGNELSGRERFGHVVVRTHGQADKGVDLFTAGGQHDHIGVGESAQLAADLEAVDARQSQVEHDDVGWVGSRRGQSLLPVGGRGDRESLMFEVAGHGPDQAGLVIHDKRPQRGVGRGGRW